MLPKKAEPSAFIIGVGQGFRLLARKRILCRKRASRLATTHFRKCVRQRQAPKAGGTPALPGDSVSR